MEEKDIREKPKKFKKIRSRIWSQGLVISMPAVGLPSYF